MNLKPKAELTATDVEKGLKMIIWDGLTAEVMISFTGGAFLISMALLLGATNFQIGLLATMPMFTNIFQLLSIWLVSKYHNRRAVTVYCAFLARIPLIVIGLLSLYTTNESISILLFFLFFHYLLGSIAGPSWNSWMKDMVPESILGSYFSRRSKYTQILNVVLSIGLAIVLDFIKKHYPSLELNTYALFFIIAGLIGILGGYLLSLAPEPQSYLSDANVFDLFKQPLKNLNFRRVLVFNSAWVFALNIATPFFTVFMLKGMALPLSYIIILSIISQLFSILTIRTWGAFSDRYSNKSIISLCAPIYIVCIIGWCFVGLYSRFYLSILLLVVIHAFTGIATAGINLSLTNIGLKLAPKKDAIVYLSVRNIITAVFSSLGPLLGGVLADFFQKRSLLVTAQYVSPEFNKAIKLLYLHEWNFLFLIGALLALLSLNLLNRVKEFGEIHRDIVKRIMRTSLRNNLKEYFIIGDLIGLHEQLRTIVKSKARQFNERNNYEEKQNDN
jgi:MFS family permease